MELSEIKKQFDRAEISLVAVSADELEPLSTFSEKNNILLPLLSDSDLAVIRAYGLEQEKHEISVPATLIISKDGEVLWRLVGDDIVNRPSGKDVLNKATALLGLEK